MTADLVAFLRARLDEDEQVALAAQRGPWDVEETDEYTHGGMEVRADYSQGRGTVCSGFQFHADRVHIARHDPARVLADVEAKRAIVRAYADAETLNRRSGIPPAVYLGLLFAVRHLGLPHSEHPDYRQEWAP